MSRCPAKTSPTQATVHSMSRSELIKSEQVPVHDVKVLGASVGLIVKGVTTVAELVCVGILMLAACGSSQQQASAGGPGNKRRQMLASDPVLDALTAGAVLAKPIEKKPAGYRAPAFQTTG